jgi:hypothetical protein
MQVGIPVITVRLRASLKYRKRHLIVGSAASGNGLMALRSCWSCGGGIKGTSREKIGARPPHRLKCEW